MSLAPLLAEPIAIQIHAFAALAAFFLGAWQLVAAKGDGRHRAVGRVWAILMVIVAATGFFIHEIRLWGPWSPIHLLSIIVLVNVPLAIIAARAGNIRAHKVTMASVYAGGLVVAGAFTFWPGRVMHAMLFGG